MALITKNGPAAILTLLVITSYHFEGLLGPRAAIDHLSRFTCWFVLRVVRFVGRVVAVMTLRVLNAIVTASFASSGGEVPQSLGLRPS